MNSSLKVKLTSVGLTFLIVGLASCGTQSVTKGSSAVTESSVDETPASVIAVETTEEASGYLFSVTVRSPDTGCDRYANWWEVITEEGDLIYRRTLAHSHIEEQPFTRSGGPIESDLVTAQPVIVRVHMHPDGYSDRAMSGTVGETFRQITLPADFAAELAESSPWPKGCAF
ncbi:hypothetical protein S7335_3625 [Synechococcus sp. PCC 7335]|uniref:hypothetical protein n=1 Tax=Synechococcus sp. (strain ATCC 29403 / PCC 7335) TaxID=91464 RepID=UPI00017ED64B|nr:hypothetical protein [Synechococcus sp. PCC 7335]EDX85922.1 hypothetical protein S7335_3625 [Synechococcus sp. PCC 7335]